MTFGQEVRLDLERSDHFWRREQACPPGGRHLFVRASGFSACQVCGATESSQDFERMVALRGDRGEETA